MSLDALSATFGLPRTYLRQLAVRDSIPSLTVSGKLKFDESSVRHALNQLAAPPTSTRINALIDLAATAAAEARATSAGHVQQVRQIRGLRVCLQRELEAGDGS